MALCRGIVSSYEQDSFWSWFICFCTTICMILSTGFTFALGVLFPVFMDHFDENREGTAWVSSTIIGLCCFLGPVMSAILNKFGVRVSTILGCLSCSAALVLGSFAPNIIILCIAFSLPFGIGMSSIFLCSPIIMTHYFTKRRSLALGIVTAGQGMGTMILGPTLQALVDVLGWKNSFRVFAGLLTVASLTGVFLHRRRTSEEADEQQEARGKKFLLDFSLLKNPIILLLASKDALETFARMVPYVHLMKYCDDLGIPADKSSTFYLFLGVFTAVGRLAGGFLCNLRSIKSRLLNQAVAFVVGASTMLLTLAKTYAELVAFVIVFSVADGIMITSLIIEIMESVKESERASAFGLLMMTSGAFALGSPPLSGFMADRFGNYVAAFLVAGGVGIIGSLIQFLLICVKQEQNQNFNGNIEGRVKTGQSEGVNEHDLKPRSCTEDSIFKIRSDRLRSSSFTLAMESPFYY